MLSKKHFNSSVTRLRESLTTSELVEMLRYQLTNANEDNEYSEIIAGLNSLPESLMQKVSLDRRRAENYLSKSLYDKNHAQIAHLMPKHHKGEKDEDFALRAKLYGIFLGLFATAWECGPEVRNYFWSLAKKLRASSIENFHISFKGFGGPVSSAFGFDEHHALMIINFLNLEFVIESKYVLDTKMACGMKTVCAFYSLSVNGNTSEEFGKSIGYFREPEQEDEILTLLTDVAYYLPEDVCDWHRDFYSPALPKGLLDKHLWSNEFEAFDLETECIKGSLLSAVYRLVRDEYKAKEELLMSISSLADHDSVSLKVNGFYSDRGSLVFKSDKYNDSLVISCIYKNLYDDFPLDKIEIYFNNLLLCSEEGKIEKRDVWYNVADVLSRNIDNAMSTSRRNKQLHA